MGWSLGWNTKQRRWIGYGVPAYCDHEGCNEEIDRGLGYQCDCECEKFYCSKHRYEDRHNDAVAPREHPLWRDHVLAHSSWKTWRDENPEATQALRAST